MQRSTAPASPGAYRHFLSASRRCGYRPLDRRKRDSPHRFRPCRRLPPSLDALALSADEDVSELARYMGQPATYLRIARQITGRLARDVCEAAGITVGSCPGWLGISRRASLPVGPFSATGRNAEAYG
jgi:hypothetical protein